MALTELWIFDSDLKLEQYTLDQDHVNHQVTSKLYMNEKHQITL